MRVLRANPKSGKNYGTLKVPKLSVKVGMTSVDITRGIPKHQGNNLDNNLYLARWVEQQKNRKHRIGELDLEDRKPSSNRWM